MLIAVPIGVLCAIVNFLVVIAVRALSKQYKKMSRPLKVVTFTLHGVGSACIGVVVFRTTGLHGIWGMGAESLQEALSGSGLALDYFVFAVGKLLAMVLGIAVKGPGDIWEPYLITGGFTGGLVGHLLARGTGVDEEVLKPCIIFGMVGLFACCFRFPLTPVILVMEMTGVNTYSLVLPSVLASFTAISCASRMCHSVLDEVMNLDGINLRELAERSQALAAQAEQNEEELMSLSNTMNSVQSSRTELTSRVFQLINDSLLQQAEQSAPIPILHYEPEPTYERQLSGQSRQSTPNRRRRPSYSNASGHERRRRPSTCSQGSNSVPSSMGSAHILCEISGTALTRVEKGSENTDTLQDTVELETFSI